MKLALVVLVACAARAHAKGCHEHSDVVGFAHCSHFGSWSPDDPQMPRLWIELGDLTERFDAPSLVFGNGAMAETGPAHAIATAVTLRILYGFDARFYVGGELSMGGLVSVVEQLVPGTSDNSSVFESARAIAGVHTAIRNVELAAELAAGVRSYDVFGCEDPMCMASGDDGHTRAIVNARLRADYFIARSASIGVAIGNGLVDRDDREAMVMVAFHTRALDGN